MISNSDLGTMNYANGQPHQLSSYGTRTFVYDTAGNMTRNGGITKFTWDWRSRLTNTFDIATANNTYYGYDHNNQRFIKWTEDYVYVPPIIEEEQALRDLPAEPYIPEESLSSDVPLLEEEAGLDSAGYWEWQVISKDEYIDKYYEKNLNNQTKSHIYLNDIKIATVNNSDQPYYLLTDHLSSSSILTDSTGTTAQLTDYKPYGNINYDNELIDLKNDYKFTGQEYDEENALQYFGARYLDNQIARFASVDPMLSMFNNEDKLKESSGGDLYSLLSSPQRFNSYSYAINNPLKYNDPTGKDAKVTINGKNNTITVKSDIYLKGDGATNTVAERMQKNINETWNKGWTYYDADTDKTYNVKFDVKVAVTKCPVCHALGGDNNIIDVGSTDRSWVLRDKANQGAWRSNEPDPAPHEFGHLLGLDDKYSDTSGTYFGWEGNIMAESAMQGSVEQRNIDTMLSDFVSQYNDRWIKWDKERTYHLAPRGEFK